MPDTTFLQELKNEICKYISYNTHRNYIDWQGCDNICYEIKEKIEPCKRHFEVDPIEAIMGMLLLVHTLVELALEADSRSGYLDSVADEALENLEFLTKQMAHFSVADREGVLSVFLEESRHEIYEGWSEWRYGLLRSAVPLCDKKLAPQLESELDKYSEPAGNKEDDQREDIVTRYLLHRHLCGIEATRAELYENLRIERLRELAMEDALNSEDFIEAEQLSLEIINEYNAKGYGCVYTDKWLEYLYDIYLKAGWEEKRIALAEQRLLSGTYTYWETLKEYYLAAGRWEFKRQDILNILGKRDGFAYRQILRDEGERKLLLESIQRSPNSVFEYAEYIAEEYPDEIFEICRRDIIKSGDRARNRVAYRCVANNIWRLHNMGGSNACAQIIEYFRAKYPRRTALQEELDEVEAGFKEGN